MADLNELQSAGAVKIIGSNSSNVETNPVNADSNGNLFSVINNASGASAVNIQDGGNSITVDGNLSTSTADGYQLDGAGRLRVSDTDLIESLHFSNTDHPLLVNKSLTGSSTGAFSSANSSLRLTNTTSSSDSAIVQTKRYFRYNPGRSYIITVSGNVGAKKNNVRQRLGYFDANNGLFFEQTGTDLAVVVRTNSSGSPVDTRVLQANWNVDKLDGTGASGITLDTSKHNLYVIDFLWHGAGRIRYGIFFNGKIVYCHQTNTANVNSGPFMRTPCLPVRAELVNTGTSASTTTMDLVCFAYQKEASDNITAPYSFSSSTGRNSTSVGATALPIISIRPKTTFNSLTNRIPIVPENISVISNNQPVIVSIVLNPTLTGASYTSADTNSATEYDITATAVSGGTIVKQFYVAASTSLLSSAGTSVATAMRTLVLGLDIAGSVQDVVTVVVQSTAGGTTVFGQIDWQEYQ